MNYIEQTNGKKGNLHEKFERISLDYSIRCAHVRHTCGTFQLSFAEATGQNETAKISIIVIIAFSFLYFQ